MKTMKLYYFSKLAVFLAVLAVFLCKITGGNIKEKEAMEGERGIMREGEKSEKQCAALKGLWHIS